LIFPVTWRHDRRSLKSRYLEPCKLAVPLNECNRFTTHDRLPPLKCTSSSEERILWRSGFSRRLLLLLLFRRDVRHP
jgi:hypothetical protein